MKWHIKESDHFQFSDGLPSENWIIGVLGKGKREWIYKGKRIKTQKKKNKNQ